MLHPRPLKSKNGCPPWVASSRPQALAMVLRMGKSPSPSCACRCHPSQTAHPSIATRPQRRRILRLYGRPE